MSSRREDTGGNFWDGIVAWFRGLGMWTRFLIVATITLWIISKAWYNVNVQLYLMWFPIRFNYEFWRFITAPFYSDTWPMVFGLWAYIPISREREQDQGTIQHILNFFLLGIQIAIVAIGLELFFGEFLNIQEIWIIYYFGGYFNLYMADRTYECFKHPERVTSMMFIPMPIPAKVIPFLILGISAAWSRAIPVSMFAAMIVGLFHCIYQPRIQFLKQTLYPLEKNCGCCYNLFHYIPIDKATGIILSRPSLEYSDSGFSGTPFAGKGVTLGGNLAPPVDRGAYDSEAVNTASSGRTQNLPGVPLNR